MKKFGFTLTEVLITMGIIGVIAALTAPALVKNSGQSKIGPSLLKFVNTWEAACEQLLVDENVSNLYAVSIFALTDSTALIEKLSKYIVMTPVSNQARAGYRIYSPDGSNTRNIPADYWMYQLKDGSIIIKDDATNYGLDSQFLRAANIGRFKRNVGAVLIDINGLKGSNRTGKEVFAFTVDDKGTLIPVGGELHRAINQAGYRQNSCSLGSGNVRDGLYCTGRIADNGWVANY